MLWEVNDGNAFSTGRIVFTRLRELEVEGSLKPSTESSVEGMSFPGWKEESHFPMSLTWKE